MGLSVVFLVERVEGDIARKGVLEPKRSQSLVRALRAAGVSLSHDGRSAPATLDAKKRPQSVSCAESAYMRMSTMSGERVAVERSGSRDRLREEAARGWHGDPYPVRPRPDGHNGPIMSGSTVSSSQLQYASAQWYWEERALKNRLSCTAKWWAREGDASRTRRLQLTATPQSAYSETRSAR